MTPGWPTPTGRRTPSPPSARLRRHRAATAAAAAANTNAAATTADHQSPLADTACRHCRPSPTTAAPRRIRQTRAVLIAGALRAIIRVRSVIGNVHGSRPLLIPLRLPCSVFHKPSWRPVVSGAPAATALTRHRPTSTRRRPTSTVAARRRRRPHHTIFCHFRPSSFRFSRRLPAQ